MKSQRDRGHPLDRMGQKSQVQDESFPDSSKQPGSIPHQPPLRLRVRLGLEVTRPLYSNSLLCGSTTRHNLFPCYVQKQYFTNLVCLG